VALGFVAALEGARTHLSAHPGIGSARFAVVTGIGELRDFPLDRYPYVFLYTDDLDAVRIHRVLHTSRDIPAALAEHR
jgi:toxin ParE1/3/4